MDEYIQAQNLIGEIRGSIEPAFPKTIAEIILCGSVTFRVYEGSNFIKPTEEQKKNLKEMLCIEIKIRDDELGEYKMDKKKVCATCKYHQFESMDDGYVCVNDESEYLSDWTDFNHTCECWSGKDEE